MQKQRDMLTKDVERQIKIADELRVEMLDIRSRHTSAASKQEEIAAISRKELAYYNEIRAVDVPGRLAHHYSEPSRDEQGVRSAQSKKQPSTRTDAKTTQSVGFTCFDFILFSHGLLTESAGNPLTKLDQ